MTKEESYNEYTESKVNSRTGKIFTWLDIQYASEAWHSMTKSEQKNCSFEQMDGYIQDTYDAVVEQQIN